MPGSRDDRLAALEAAVHGERSAAAHARISQLRQQRALARIARARRVEYNPDQPRDYHGRWSSGGGDRNGDSVGEARQVAADLVAKATSAEPSLTAKVSDLVEAKDGKMAGLDFRVKTTDSLARKIETDVQDTGNTPAEVGAKMFDVNRYTGVFPEAQYAEHSQAVIDQMRANGNQLTVKNYWTVPDNPYQGINVQVTSPEGQKFELQFHTDTSLAVKEGELHQIYEKARTTTSQRRIREYTAQSFAAAAKIPVPPGVSSVG